jgi:hypothetical protein
MSKKKSAKPHRQNGGAVGPVPLPEEAFDRMVDFLDGPVNRAAERLLKSKVVLWPIGLSLHLTFSMWARFLGTHGQTRAAEAARETALKNAGGAR